MYGPINSASFKISLEDLRSQATQRFDFLDSMNSISFCELCNLVFFDLSLKGNLLMVVTDAWGILIAVCAIEKVKYPKERSWPGRWGESIDCRPRTT